MKISGVNLGDHVRCLAGDIDRNEGKDCNGVVVGFARFSPYHSREAYVRFSDGSSGWFWQRDLERLVTESR